MADFTVLVPEPPARAGARGWRTEEIDVAWEVAAAAIPAEARARIDRQWAACMEEARSRGKTLFNGPITRLIDASQNAGRVRLRLGPSDYQTFVVTVLRDRTWFETHAPEVMARALGNSVLLTHGDAALLGIRSERVSVYAGRAHVIGGVLDLLGTRFLPATVDGLLGHLAIELREEARVTMEDLAPRPAWPRLMGVFRDEFLGQPEAVWQWETVTPLEEIAHRLDVREHSGPLIVKRGPVTARVLDQMTPVARHTWRQWSGQ